MAVIIEDGFDYAVGRTPTDEALKFRDTGPWDGVKAVNSGEPGACTYLYTVNRTAFEAATGNSDPFPGSSPNGYVMCQEYPGGTYEVGQADCYLTKVGEMPVNIWFQFWWYSPHADGYQESDYEEGKFIYP